MKGPALQKGISSKHLQNQNYVLLSTIDILLVWASIRTVNKIKGATFCKLTILSLFLSVGFLKMII